LLEISFSLGLQVAALDPLGELDLLRGGQERVAASFGEELGHRIDGVVQQLSIGLTGGRYSLLTCAACGMSTR
jgi:hypothetical protein